MITSVIERHLNRKRMFFNRFANNAHNNNHNNIRWPKIDPKKNVWSLNNMNSVNTWILCQDNYYGFKSIRMSSLFPFCAAAEPNKLQSIHAQCSTGHTLELIHSTSAFFHIYHLSHADNAIRLITLFSLCAYYFFGRDPLQVEKYAIFHLCNSIRIKYISSWSHWMKI